MADIVKKKWIHDIEEVKEDGTVVLGDQVAPMTFMECVIDANGNTFENKLANVEANVATRLATKVSEAPYDDQYYARFNGEWKVVPGTGGAIAAEDVTFDVTGTAIPAANDTVQKAIAYVAENAGGNVEVDGTTISKTADDKLQIKDGGVSAAKLDAALTAEIDGKVDAETGKGLSSNDYTDAEKAKVATVPTTLTTDLAKLAALPDATALQGDLDLKADKASPALTGTPTAPTAAAGTNTQQIATTAFVTSAVDAETTARTSAIAAETSARTAADTLLTTNLATEVAAREAAVDNLNAAIASGVGTTAAVIQPTMTATSTSTTDGVSAKGIADFVAEQKAQVQADVDDLAQEKDQIKDALLAVTIFDKDGVVAALNKIEQILRKAVYVDDEESAIDAYKVLVNAINGDKPVIGAVVSTPSVTITDNVMTASCSTSGASIYYTLDGTTPTSSSTLYTSAVTLTDSCTIKAIAIKDGDSSSVRTTTYSKPTGNYITFADSNVKAVLVASSVNTDGDDEISYDEAAAATALPDFENNTAITSFNELQYFTGLAQIGENKFKGCTSLTSVILPAQVSQVSPSVFSGCTALTSVTIPNGVTFTSTAQSLFFNCTSLTSITLPDSVTLIPSSTFRECTNLANVTMSDNVESIGAFAFYKDANIELTSLPASLKSVGQNAFSNCTKLAVSTLPSGMTTLGGYAFYSTLVSFVTIPSTVTSMAEYCFGSTKVTISEVPSGITVIPNFCFYNCKQITEFTLHTGITEIKKSAFASCSNLTKVKLLMTAPPTLGDAVFPSTTQFYLPDDGYDTLLAQYQAAENWSTVASSRFHKISEW